ncbi:hypothetical protein BVC80_8967g32 [Macleaya cordata]|uniref:Transmembrane protein n=1 Tax=Macleaya cordata TaxID=56857 RepID=A0A200PLY9_MACCD|nr:hypothetical protein BVC80_8967g32 [Macleaya cordata]
MVFFLFQVPAFSGFPTSFNGDFQMFPIIYPAFVPGLIPLQNQEQANNGAGIYAVPVLPSMGPMAGFPPNSLIPLTYSIPTRTSPPEGGAVGEEHGQQEGRQQHAPHRQVVVRRFHFAFQLDLLLILKLAAVIFVFNQDGSRQRLLLLVFFASLVYLYQTGALTPLIRWLSQGMQRAGAPPQPRPPVRAENAPAAIRPDDENAAPPEVQPGGAENVNQLGEDGNQPAENENNRVEPGGREGINWWVIMKEIQMIVVGFITSLLPGFHNVD